MPKPVYLLTLLMLVSRTFCEGQNRNDQPEDIKRAGIHETVTPHGPKRITRTIKQDSKGNIWMAAFDGVFRYDGKSFTHITGKVSTARFFSVLEDREGNFWFSSVGSGVYYYDGKSFQNFTTTDGLADDRVTDIYEDKAGNIWFATESGASRYDGKSFQTFTTENVNSIIEDKTGKFWFGTRGNVWTYDGKAFTLITHESQSFINVRTIIEDKKGNIWLGGKDGLWRYDGGTFTRFSQNFVGYVCEDRNGNILTSSEIVGDSGESGGWALLRYDEKSLFNKSIKIYETGDYSKNIFCILEDNDGNIWFGSSGVYRYDGKTFTDFKSKADEK